MKWPKCKSLGISVIADSFLFNHFKHETADEKRIRKRLLSQSPHKEILHAKTTSCRMWIRSWSLLAPFLSKYNHMQEGSLLIMVKPFGESTIKILQTNGFTRWPVPDPNNIHMVTAIQDVSHTTTKFKISIQIDTFPEIANSGFWFNPECFCEVEPPSINLEKLFEKEKKKNPDKVAVPV